MLFVYIIIVYPLLFFFFSFIVKIYTDELFNVCSVGYLLQSEYNMN